MEDYWLVIDHENLSIEICFPNRKRHSINACLATISLEEQAQLLKRLQQITRDTPPFTLTYEYFKLSVNPYITNYDFYMFDEPVSYFLCTETFTNALAEYLEEMKKLRMRAKQ